MSSVFYLLRLSQATGIIHHIHTNTHIHANTQADLRWKGVHNLNCLHTINILKEII